jgi:hypothetical protein
MAEISSDAAAACRLEISPIIFEKISKQSTWYGERARRNGSRYVALKSTQIVLVAFNPVASLAAAGDMQRWTTAVLTGPCRYHRRMDTARPVSAKLDAVSDSP